MLSQSLPLLALAATALGFPDLPFKTSGSEIITSKNTPIKVAGTNWPGHNDVMVPEGLQYRSIKGIVSDLKSTGMNVIRLTYAIEMIDQLLDENKSDLQSAFVDALGETEGMAVLQQVLANNPEFSATSSRLDVYDAIVEELNAQGIYVNLDNHISSGEWCCSSSDGNTWWGDEYFDADKWLRGLAYMADHGKAWPNLMSMSLRNELREPSNNATLLETYNWQTWYKYVREGAQAIGDANPDPLIILSGLNYDTTLQPVVRGKPLTPGDEVFSFDDFPADKIVFELHNYNTEATNCGDITGALYNGGAQAMVPDDETTVNAAPVLITEFGFDQTEYQGVYATCLADWMPDNTAGWMQWVVAGSYYIRSGTPDYEETWALYDHEWQSWRVPEYVEGIFSDSIAATLADNA
ncbi:glycoside hydrolase family 5 protein [Emericellopsis atlantica]|uniref:Glycoside hydrolase family 5 protein n=1 Tax=Emericellopsis atlantica TaxID=2614577 RepID=A0A9P7ZFG7_9HYPO|nr:glycoside hydrolase family 5 protein [Emericellopsis atlantica]KAG9251020.1 glycoside hydrolase family 5 protein [Emericellopsis atlantica]